jgi:hypothetical protein
MIMTVRVARALLSTSLFALVACSSTDAGAPSADASPDATSNRGDASRDVETTECDRGDERKPECLRGGPCSCDDQMDHNGVAVCTQGGWKCPVGYTRFEDCEGVPPGPSCFRDASASGDASEPGNDGASGG